MTVLKHSIDFFFFLTATYSFVVSAHPSPTSLFQLAPQTGVTDGVDSPSTCTDISVLDFLEIFPSIGPLANSFFAIFNLQGIFLMFVLQL